MTIHKMILRSSFANNVGRAILSGHLTLFDCGCRSLYICFKLMRICIFDFTSVLSSLPFGNWLCLAYFGAAWALLSDACYGGELWRILIRMVRLIWYDRIGWLGILARTQTYVGRVIQHTLYLGWEMVKPPLKKYTVTFVKEIVLENADDLKQLLTTAAGSTLTAVLINTLSSQLIRDITPILSELTKPMKDGSRLLEDVEVIRQSTLYTESHLSKMDQRLADLHLQLEYMRINQPDQFKEIVMRMLPFVTAKDLLALGATVPSRVLRFLTNGGTYTNIHSLENGPLF